MQRGKNRPRHLSHLSYSTVKIEMKFIQCILKPNHFSEISEDFEQIVTSGRRMFDHCGIHLQLEARRTL